MTSIIPSRWPRRLSTLVVVTLAGCQTETTLEQAPASRHLQVLTLSQLPPAIREQALSVGSALQKQSLFSKNERSFGTVANGRIHRVERPDGRVSYTLPLRKLGAGLYYDNLVIEQLPNGTTSETLIRYEPQREWWQQSQGVYDYATYSGRVSFFTATGEPIASADLQDGKLISPKRDNSITAARTEISCTLVDIQYAGLVQDTTYYITDIMFFYECEISYYNDSNLGGNGPVGVGGGGAGVGSAPVGEESVEEEDGGAGNGDTQDTQEEEEEIIINPEFLAEYPCQAAMVQEVYGNCAPLSQLFQAIFESNDKVNVTFIAEDLNDIFMGGDTNSPLGSPLNYIVRLNTERLTQSTELDIINTATHEYVHAILFYFYQAGSFQLTNTGNPPSYADLAEAFAQHRAGFGGDHHPYMASLVNDIAEVTYEWAITNGGYNPANFSSYDTNPADGINGLQEFLQKLAWGGLEETSAFQMLYPDNTLAEQQIKKLMQDEIFPNDGDATPKGNSPVPCN